MSHPHKLCKCTHDINKHVDVIIIGGGISGLAAARVLAQEGISYVLLEGRNRIGGRIHSVNLPADPDNNLLTSVDVDLGANYLIGCSSKPPDQACFHLANEVKCKSVPCAGDIGEKYRGWECVEFSEWYCSKTGKFIETKDVVEMVFFLDRVQNHVKRLYGKNPKKYYNDSLESVFNEAINDLLEMDLSLGLRTTTKLTSRQMEIFHCLLSRYVGYVNPLKRMPALIIPEIYTEEVDCEPDLTYPSEEKSRIYVDSFKARWSKIIKPLEPTNPNRPNVKWEDRLVLDRFSSIPEALAKGLHIHLNTSVKQINWSLNSSSTTKTTSSSTTNSQRKLPPNVSVTVRSLDDSSGGVDTGNCEHVLRARYCIVTVPVGVLKHNPEKSGIEFIPALPASKQEAIHRLGIPNIGAETHDKVILRYRPEDVFWTTNTPHLECLQNSLHFLNLHMYGKPGVILAHLWGASSIHPIGLTDDEVVQIVCEHLEGMFREKRKPSLSSSITTTNSSSSSTTTTAAMADELPFPKPVQTIVTRWSEDIFSLGAYTSGEVMSSDLDRHNYAASLPDDNTPIVLFAGEGTLDSNEAKECTHGALISGFHAAEKILFREKPSCRLPLTNIAAYLMGKVKSTKSMVTRYHKHTATSRVHSMGSYSSAMQTTHDIQQQQSHQQLQLQQQRQHLQQQHNNSHMTEAELSAYLGDFSETSSKTSVSSSSSSSEEYFEIRKRRRKSAKSKKSYRRTSNKSAQ